MDPACTAHCISHCSTAHCRKLQSAALTRHLGVSILPSKLGLGDCLQTAAATVPQKTHLATAYPSLLAPQSCPARTASSSPAGASSLRPCLPAPAPCAAARPHPANHLNLSNGVPHVQPIFAHLLRCCAPTLQMQAAHRREQAHSAAHSELKQAGRQSHDSLHVLMLLVTLDAAFRAVLICAGKCPSVAAHAPAAP